MTFADAGIAVALIDVSGDALERGRATIARPTTPRSGRGGSMRTNARAGRADRDGASFDRSRRTSSSRRSSRTSRSSAKCFRALGARAARRILATNTSTLNVDAIAAAAPRPERSLGMHFFSPAHVMRLLEIVRGTATAPATIGHRSRSASGSVRFRSSSAIATDSSATGCCTAIVARRNCCSRRVRRPEQVDGALRASASRWGRSRSPISPASTSAGAPNRNGSEKGPSPFRLSNLPDLLVAAGRLGQKTGAGYYRYEGGGRTPLADPAVDELIAGERARLGIVPRARRRRRDRRALRLCLINEGRAFRRRHRRQCRQRRHDLATGYGFPAARGGPMTYARELGYGRDSGGDPRIRARRPRVLAAGGWARGGRLGKWYNAP